MKKNLFLLGVAVAALASCTSHEVVEVAQNRAIAFDSFVDNATKAVTETKNDNLKTEGFAVYGGYENQATLFNGDKVTYNTTSGKWEYTTGDRFWIKDEVYKFAAYGPESAGGTKTFTYNNGHLTITDYEVTDLATGSVDLIYAAPHTATGVTGLKSNNQTVAFSFKHIMSWVKIKFVNKFATGNTVAVSDIKVEGVNAKSTFNGSGTTDARWTAPTETATFEKQTFSDLTTFNTTGTVDFIAIPQTINTNTMKISFILNVTDAGGNKVVSNKNITCTLAAQQVWKENMIYVYTAELNTDVADLEKIEFSGTVESWGTPGADIPVTPDTAP